MKKLATVILTIVMIGIAASDLHGQSLNLKIGAFSPGMNSDLWEVNLENLAFDKQDMLGAYFGVELELFMGRHFSLALEGGHYRQEIFSVYEFVTYDDGSPINQDLFLRVSSLEADIKLYPTGHRKLFIPYIGGGMGFYFWKYYQGGEFVDFEQEIVYEGEADTDRISLGFNVKAGFIYRWRRSVGISFESKYIFLKGQLSSLFEGFEKLDLSGFTFTVGLNLFLR